MGHKTRAQTAGLKCCFMFCERSRGQREGYTASLFIIIILYKITACLSKHPELNVLKSTRDPSRRDMSVWYFPASLVACLLSTLCFLCFQVSSSFLVGSHPFSVPESVAICSPCRSIRCLRNIIHWNLITAFILRNATWFIVQLTMSPEVHESNVVRFVNPSSERPHSTH